VKTNQAQTQTGTIDYNILRRRQHDIKKARGPARAGAEWVWTWQWRWKGRAWTTQDLRAAAAPADGTCAWEGCVSGLGLGCGLDSSDGCLPSAAEAAAAAAATAAAAAATATAAAATTAATSAAAATPTISQACDRQANGFRLLTAGTEKAKAHISMHIHRHIRSEPHPWDSRYRTLRANPRAAGRRGRIYHFQTTSTPPQAAAVGRAARHPRRPPPHFSAGSKTGRPASSCSQLLTSATPNSNIAQRQQQQQQKQKQKQH